MRARLRFSILALVSAIVLTLSGLHLYGVVGGTLDDVGERAGMVNEQVNLYLVEALNRQAPGSRQNSDPSREFHELVGRDEVLLRFLQKSVPLCSSVTDIVIVDETNRIIAASDAKRRGQADTEFRSWLAWQRQPLSKRIYNLFHDGSDLVVPAALVGPGLTDQKLTVRAHLSPQLLRAEVEPQIADLAALSLFSLALSAVLAILVSNTVAGSLERIRDKIDRIARGETGSEDSAAFSSPELAEVDSRLWGLGRQFSGARADIIHLRSSLDGMLRKLEEGVLVFNADGRLQTAGEAAERLLARPKAQLLGATLDEVFPAWTELGVAVRKARDEGTLIREKLVRLDRMNMPPVSLLVTVEPIRHDDQTLGGTLVTLRDADTRKQIKSDFQMTHRLAAIGQIMSGVAHEIKNPLNAMMLHLELASARSQRDPEVLADLAVVQREMRRLDRVVRTLLEFNQPVEVRLARCDLRDLVQQLVDLIQSRADGQKVEVKVEKCGIEPAVEADIELVKQAALNVAVNALEAMPEGGVLQLSIESEPGVYVLVVTDTGPGVPPDIRDKIFNLYFTTKPNSAGIGLAITYRLMQLHSGGIRVESEPGKGARFRLSLPEYHPRSEAA